MYAVALYVEAELAAKELGIRYRGGFFESDDDYCSALVDGAFSKTLVVSLQAVWCGHGGFMKMLSALDTLAPLLCLPMLARIKECRAKQLSPPRFAQPPVRYCTHASSTEYQRLQARVDRSLSNQHPDRCPC